MVDVRLPALLGVLPISLLADSDSFALCDLHPLLPCLPLHVEVVTLERLSRLVVRHVCHAHESVDVAAFLPEDQLSMAELVEHAPLPYTRAELVVCCDRGAEEDDLEVCSCLRPESLGLGDLSQLLSCVLHGWPHVVEGVAVPYATNIRIYPEIKKQKMRRDEKKRGRANHSSPSHQPTC